MSWHGQINRTIWEIRHLIEQRPKDLRLRRELLRTHFLQRFEYDRSHHIPRDDRSFLFLQDGRTPACLLLHGANGTPAEMRDLGNYLYSKGFTVFCPRASRFDAKDRPVTWESWVTLARDALETTLDYSKKTMLVGLSIGGTVAMTLNQVQPVPAMALLAPAVAPKLGFKGQLYSIVRHISPTLFYRYAGWNGEIAKAMDHVRNDIKDITTPTLVLQALDDRVMSTKGLKILRRRVTHEDSEVVVLPSGTHALTRGKAKNDVFERVFQFAVKQNLITLDEST
ncbi:MAG: alpha/beta hydrolase [Candidatus Latescibacterota bacterium]|nr:MAG: alpha/beta hydrolase [Candidatus Latescibacterota bacterium]